MHNDTLHIIDLSPFCHAGNVNKHARFESLVECSSIWKSQITPAGGVSLVFNKLYNIVGLGDVIVACDRNPVIKKDMCLGYKGQRKHSSDIELQKKVAEYVLKKCGVKVLAYDGYEADDIIYTLVKKLHDAYEHIYIYTGDTDLDVLVDDKVELMPSSSKAKHITKANYNQVVDKDGGILYNTHTILKIIYGDSSDSIPGLPKEIRGDVHRELLSDPADYPYYGDKLFVLQQMGMHFYEYLKQVDIVFPLMVDDIDLDICEPDKNLIAAWGSAMGNKFFRGTSVLGFDKDSEIREMQNLGLFLEDDTL